MRAATDIRRTFSLPPELTRSAPRDVALTTGGRALLLFAWLLAAGAPVAGGALYLQAQRRSELTSRLDRGGVAANAVVDRVWRKSGDGKPPYAAFHFEADGVRIDAEKRMQLSAWRELRAGSTIPVRYLLDDPREFVVAGQRRRQLPFVVPYAVSSVLAALALLCAAAVRWQRTLLSEGRPAPAVVTAVRKHKGSHGTTHHQITYEFRLPAGTISTGKAAGKTEVAATITVVYDPERPGRNRPYPFSLVTLNREW